MDIASLVSAVAATTGAVLAGVTVYISGRRDESKWRREVLLETCEAFLNASFETARAGGQLAGFPAPRDAVTRDEPELPGSARSTHPDGRHHVGAPLRRQTDQKSEPDLV